MEKPSLLSFAATMIRVRGFALVASAASSAALTRVVVLHGKGGCGASMAAKFEPIIKALPECEFEFACAPHLTGAGSYAWWTLPPGVRSFEAARYEGWERSMTVLRGYEHADVFWGHSQGAILLAACAARAAVGESDEWLRSKRFVVNGASWPAPFEKALLDALASREAGASPPLDALHVLGLADQVNPPEHAQRIADCLGGQLFAHDGGHYVPTDVAAVARYRSFLLSREKEPQQPARAAGGG